MRRTFLVELALVALLALAMLLPGIWSYTLVDPWETHYGEVARRMLQDDDLVHTQWQDEGFRSKPVLTFWLMAASLRSLGVAEDGGYSGEMVSSPIVMLAIRLPFVLFGVLGLVAAWWMLARLASRRVAWLAVLVLGTTPFYLLVARQGITDMTLVGSMIGAIAMFAVAGESSDAPVEPLLRLGRRHPIAIDQRHVLALVVGGFVLAQAFYYVAYFSSHRAAVQPGLHPGLLVAMPMLVALALLALLELPDRGARAIAYWPAAALSGVGLLYAGGRLVGGFAIDRVDRALEVRPTTTARQVYLLWFWVFLGVSVLGKGLVALGIVGLGCAFYVILLGRWRDLLDDRYEIVRGLLIVVLVAVPWHVAMWFADGARFVHEYFITHLWNRAAVGVHGDRGTFDYYASQVGYGMFVWVALLPAALAALVLRTRLDAPAGRARFLVAIWAVTSVAFFSIIQTKFHHYILPAIPAFAIAIAFWLDDVLAGRARRLGAVALVGAGLVLLVAHDMMGEPKQWIEMFVYRYDRPWPGDVDLSDGFLGLGVAAALALAVLAAPRLEKLGVVLIAGVALAAALWSMYGYMPVAARHWGMREAIRHYYDQRDLHGARLVYLGARQLADDWRSDDADGVRDTWTIRTVVPERVQEGQPVAIRVTVRSHDDRRVDEDLRLTGTIARIDADDDAIVVALPPTEQAKLAPLVRAGASAPPGIRPPIRAVDADRLIAWQLYWRGENFWTGDEIWGRLPEMQTAFKDTDNVKFLRYLNDRTLAPEGRRYWVITEAGRVSNLETILPTARAKETFTVEDTTSNKFTLVSFIL